MKIIKFVKLLVIGLFIIFPFGQLTKIPNLSPTINLYFQDIIMGLILILWLFTKPKIKSDLKKPLIFFLASCFTSLLFAVFNYSLAQIFISSLYLFRFTAYSTLIFILKDKCLKLPLKKLLIFSSLVLAIFGIIQYISIPDTRFLASNHWDDHYYRVVATFFDPAFVGIILLLGLILTFFTKSSPWFYPIYLIPLLLTYSRSTYLALLVSLFSYGLYKRKIKTLLIGLFFLLKLLVHLS